MLALNGLVRSSRQGLEHVSEADSFQGKAFPVKWSRKNCHRQALARRMYHRFGLRG